MLTYFISAKFIIVERVNKPVFRVNDLNGSFDPSMIHCEDNISANNIDEINVENI